MTILRVLGLNCGTSIDGIDVALCEISSVAGTDNVEIELLSYGEVPVTPSLRTRVLNLCMPEAKTTLADICDLNFALGEEFARAVEASGIDLNEVDIVASHGQTLWHIPNGERKSTLQMAEPAVIAQRTKTTVASDFRVAEVAAGRQGAPLSGFFEAALMFDENLTRISQNIGGIGNATVIPNANCSAFRSLGGSYLTFDTGPGNMMIDCAVRFFTEGRLQYDKDGEAGRRGEAEIDHATVNEFLSHDYFLQPPPKTTGRELFSDRMTFHLIEKLKCKNMSDDAVIATITRISAESIARAYEQHVLPLLGNSQKIDEILVSGGGAYNPNIMNHLSGRFPGTKVRKLEDASIGLTAAAKEAVLFALLGFLCVCGWTVSPAALAETSEPAMLGVITPAQNYWNVMHKVLGRDDQAQKQPKMLRKVIFK